MNRIKDFINLHKQNIKNEKYLESVPMYERDSTLFDTLEFTGFYLTGYTSCGIQLGTYPNKLIKLDKEDTEYFVNKYSSKLDEELQEKINQLRKEYGK